MTRPTDDLLPPFIRDALPDDAAAGEHHDSSREPASLVPPVHELFDPMDVSQGAARLLETTSELPWRYAPFVSRIGKLWDLSDDAVMSVLTRARSPEAWRRPRLPGLSVVDVQGGPGVGDAELRLVRFERGMRFPRHRHPGPETLFVLEGNYTDSTGRFVGPGDLHSMAPGSEHSFRVGREEACIAASLQAGLEFTGPVMRVLAKLFG
ncbi:MAG TPA: cupin domain-containing protein [Polyangiaceae bacterium]|nr:cupin domain-containing protein [Polyangiaceae bacterium]